MSAYRIAGPSSFALRGRIHETIVELPEGGARRRRPWRWVLVLALCGLAAWQLSSAAAIHARAFVAQKLIALSWAQSRDSGFSRRPWPAADTRPIARLSLPSRGVNLFVLENANARSLAYGPGHVSGTARPGTWGNVVLVAHRDTHFAFLKDVSPGEDMVVEAESGAVSRYRVREVTIVEKTETRVMDAADTPQLTLITCFPFDAVRPGTNLRYVVVAERIA